MGILLLADSMLSGTRLFYWVLILCYLCTKFTKAKQSSSVVVWIGCEWVMLLKKMVLLPPQLSAMWFSCLSCAWLSVYKILQKILPAFVCFPYPGQFWPSSVSWSPLLHQTVSRGRPEQGCSWPLQRWVRFMSDWRGWCGVLSDCFTSVILVQMWSCCRDKNSISTYMAHVFRVRNTTAFQSEKWGLSKLSQVL